MAKTSNTYTNRFIVSVLDELISFMEVHDADTRKVKSFQNAIFNLERFKRPLSEQTDEEILEINGVGNSTLNIIREILESGTVSELEKYRSDTPDGVIELMGLSGLGPGKIKMLWKELGIESVEAFKSLLDSGQIQNVKGFGEKTISNIKNNLEFYLRSKNKLLLAEAEEISDRLMRDIGDKGFKNSISTTGELRRNMLVVSVLEFVAETDDVKGFGKILEELPYIHINIEKCSPYTISGIIDEVIEFCFHLVTSQQTERTLFLTTGSEEHFRWLMSKGHNPWKMSMLNNFSENIFYKENFGKEIDPEFREGFLEEEIGSDSKLIEEKDLKGIIHNHSTYSDGANTLSEMAERCRELGYEYFGIADHSRSAFFYANGMYEDRVIKQHREIDELNKEMAPFKIFKGIESDILTDGDLDYDDEILSKFDYVVASIHGSINMDEETATNRLLKAVQNPHTTIMGHLTGRLLLRRTGYPVDHQRIIDECAKYDVVIEINAHPRRLDLDWRWVKYAMEKGVKLSINPDAHSVEGLNMKYGVLAGRKGGLTKSFTLNALGAGDIEKYFNERKTKREIK